nr:uncharacterized protein LOC109168401 [Ipomoea trifida]
MHIGGDLVFTPRFSYTNGTVEYFDHFNYDEVESEDNSSVSVGVDVEGPDGLGKQNEEFVDVERPYGLGKQNEEFGSWGIDSVPSACGARGAHAPGTSPSFGNAVHASRDLCGMGSSVTLGRSDLNGRG